MNRQSFQALIYQNSQKITYSSAQEVNFKNEKGNEVSGIVLLDLMDENNKAWLLDNANIDPQAIELLLKKTVRSGFFTFKNGYVILLRNINNQPGEDPEDMVSIRIWLDSTKMITISGKYNNSEIKVFEMLSNKNNGFRSIEAFQALCKNVTENVSELILTLFSEIDDLEEKVIDQQAKNAREEINEFRRQIIQLRRFVSPQRELFLKIHSEQPDLFSDHEKKQNKDLSERYFRFVEELENLRDRAAILRDELETKLTEQMNKTMYFLSLVTFVFLPLGFVTGLLGINVGGMPGANSPLGFMTVCALLVGICVLQIVILKLKKWL